MALIASLVVGTALAAPVGEPGVLRHALVVGANDGGPGLERLRYAEDDAGRFVDVLTELGGFDADEVTVLASPDRDQLEAALRHHADLARANPQDLFLFYYSGHADARGLRLGEEVVPFGELKQQIRDLPAEVRLGVLDACRSGEITRIKGFQVTAPFATEDSLSAEGEAWLTATAADEQAQESDSLRGSFFTHYLVSGLRGAADAQGGEAGDGRVSLDEAYDYAFDRTVARTGGTDGGTQHPGYDFRLQGQGDLALTDVRRASAQIILPEDMAGEVTVLRLPEALPVAELAKPQGVPMAVALRPGRYQLRARGPEGTGEAIVGLTEGSTMKVREFREVPEELAIAKGGAGAVLPAPHTAREVDILDAPPPSREPEDWEELPLVAKFKVGMSELGTQWRRLRDEAGDAVDEFTLDAAPLDTMLPEHALALETGDLPTAARPCRAEGPGCVDTLLEAGAMPAADGRMRLLHPGGSLAAIGSLRDGRPIDDWVFFYDTGERLAAGTFLAGERSGTWSWWWPDGTKRSRGTYAGGKRAGAWIDYYENGRRRKRTTYSADEPGGMQREWYDNSRVKSAGEVLGDHRMGTWVYKYDNGKKRAKGSFDAQGRRGPWKTWHSNGRKSGEGAYVQDRRHGHWTLWHATGEKAEQGGYQHGKREGRWRTWHPDGERASRGHYQAGIKVGKWVEWDRAGLRTVTHHPETPAAAGTASPAPDGTGSTAPVEAAPPASPPSTDAAPAPGAPAIGADAPAPVPAEAPAAAPAEPPPAPVDDAPPPPDEQVEGDGNKSLDPE
jgi:antitoxin component YwqK of YwqJK toxin-antitoxin module